MPRKLATHDPALAALLSESEREDYERAVKVLLARNALLEIIEREREEQHVSKTALADRAGLDRASVRRMLTSETANPTAETALRLFAALKIKVEAVLPSGDRVSIVS